MIGKRCKKVAFLCKGRKTLERGTAALELALLLPLLMLALFGIIEFGRFYSEKIAVTHESREGVRILALSAACVPPNAMKVVTRNFTYEIPFFGSGSTSISSTAVMRCGG
jgi:Flp pilus assembly protein TadG